MAWTKGQTVWCKKSHKAQRLVEFEEYTITDSYRDWDGPIKVKVKVKRSDGTVSNFVRASEFFVPDSYINNKPLEDMTFAELSREYARVFGLGALRRQQIKSAEETIAAASKAIAYQEDMLVQIKQVMMRK